MRFFNWAGMAVVMCGILAVGLLATCFFWLLFMVGAVVVILCCIIGFLCRCLDYLSRRF